MEVYLIRHTSPAIEKGICYGQSDIGLAATFAEERRLVLGQLPPSFELVFSSPLSRCSQLAGSLKAGRYIEDERLKELNFGAWEMQAWNTIPRAELDKWGNNYLAEAPPAGESFPELKRRLLSFWQEVKEMKGKGPIAIVSHKGIIQTLLYFEGRLEEKELFVKELPYGSVLRLEL